MSTALQIKEALDPIKKELKDLVEVLKIINNNFFEGKANKTIFTDVD